MLLPLPLQGLIRNHSIAHLNLSDNNIGVSSSSGCSGTSVASPTIAGGLIAELIRRQRSLRSLELGYNPLLGAVGCAEVARALPAAPHLEALGMGR